MKTSITERLGIDLPVFAFSHTRDVVAAVTNAGGFGVLGGTRFTPDELEAELAWIDDHVGGKPYGLDIVLPGKQEGLDEDASNLRSLIPDTHLRFVEGILQDYHVVQDASQYDIADWRATGTRPETADALMEVAFAHPIRMIVNALGPPSASLVHEARSRAVLVGALAGEAKHARKSVDAGADVIIAVGTEAGGHTGEIGTMVLTPEVLREVAPVPVLAAGGIVTGQQIVAALALGAAGVWTGSVWLPTAEAETTEVVRQKMIAASSSDTLRSKARTGKPARQLRSAWHRRWDSQDDIAPLGMPLQTMLTENAFRLISAASDGGEPGAQELDSYFVGQGVGLMNSRGKVADVMLRLTEEIVEALENVARLQE